MSPRFLARALGLAASLLLSQASLHAAPIPYKIVTASERGTYIQIGRDLAKFVANLASKLEPGAVVAILDNEFAKGSSTPLSRRDAEGNTYQTRQLSTGEAFEVLKNFPTPQELADTVRPFAREAHLETLKYYWLMVFTLK